MVWIELLGQTNGLNPGSDEDNEINSDTVLCLQIKAVKVDLVKYLNGLCGVLCLTSLLRDAEQPLMATKSTGQITSLLYLEESRGVWHVNTDELNIQKDTNCEESE